MRLLALDTASGLCSAALLLDDELRWREIATPRDHARLLLPMVDELLAEAGLALGALDAIAFGRGPGSFTGLRIACSVTQGLAAGAGLPVLPVSDLRALARHAWDALAPDAAADGVAIGCLDARMGEVYWGAFRVAGGVLDTAADERVCAPARVPPLPSVAAGAVRVGAGPGFAAYPDLAPGLGIPQSGLLPAAEPRAREVARLGAADWARGLAVDAAEALPVYLRDDVAHPGGRQP